MVLAIFAHLHCIAFQVEKMRRYWLIYGCTYERLGFWICTWILHRDMINYWTMATGTCLESDMVTVPVPNCFDNGWVPTITVRISVIPSWSGTPVCTDCSPQNCQKEKKKANRVKYIENVESLLGKAEPGFFAQCTYGLFELQIQLQPSCLENLTTMLSVKRGA